MRPILPPLALALLAACDGALAPDPALRSRQEAACRAVIAAHIGRSPGEVVAEWVSETAGVAQVAARDGNRLHICKVDDAGRVLGYTHPRG